MSGHADFNEVFFDDVVIADSERLGDVNDGLAGRADHADERAALARRRRHRHRRRRRQRRRARARPTSATCRADRQALVRQDFGRAVRRPRSAIRYTGYRQLSAMSKGQLPGPEASAGKLAGTRTRAGAGRPQRPAARRRRGLRRSPSTARHLAGLAGGLPGWPSPAAPTRSCATSSANACSGLPAEPRADKGITFTREPRPPTGREPMNFDLSDEQRGPGRGGRRLLRRHHVTGRQPRRPWTTGQADRPRAGPRSPQTGFAAITVPESAGGGGGSLLDLAVVAEQAGRVLAGPSLVTAARAAVLLAGDDERLAALADGSTASRSSTAPRRSLDATTAEAVPGPCAATRWSCARRDADRPGADRPHPRPGRRRARRAAAALRRRPRAVGARRAGRAGHPRRRGPRHRAPRARARRRVRQATAGVRPRDRLVPGRQARAGRRVRRRGAAALAGLVGRLGRRRGARRAAARRRGRQGPGAPPWSSRPPRR